MLQVAEALPAGVFATIGEDGMLYAVVPDQDDPLQTPLPLDGDAGKLDLPDAPAPEVKSDITEGFFA